MASSVSVCKVGLNWDRPQAPRVYSQPKLANNPFQGAKRSARNFNQEFNVSESSVRISSFATKSSTSTTTSKKTLRVLDENMNTRLEGRAAMILSALKNA